MLRITLLISTFIVAALASGRLSILKSSKSLEFKGSDKLECESLGDVFAAALGYSVEHSSKWKGLYVIDPFQPPKAVVSIVVDGIDKVHTDAKSNTYDVSGTGCQESLDSLMYRIPSAVEHDFSQDGRNSFGNVKIDKTVSALKPQSNNVDKQFLEQIAAVAAAANDLETRTEIPALFTVRLSIAPLIAEHSLSSPAVTEALKLVSAAIEQLKAAAQKACGDNVLVAVSSINNDVPIRHKRNVQSGEPITNRTALNLGLIYNDTYPVMFNIILWFGVVMVFSLLAISYTIGYMDPGRDSIIYRMTSTRMKKDN